MIEELFILRLLFFILLSLTTTIFALIEWLLFDAKWVIFGQHLSETSCTSMRWWWCPLCTRPNMLSCILIVLAHWNNSLQVNILLLSKTLSWFWADQSFLNTVYRVPSREVANTGTNRGLKSTIYHSQGTHVNHYTTDWLRSSHFCGWLYSWPFIFKWKKIHNELIKIKKSPWAICTTFNSEI